VRDRCQADRKHVKDKKMESVNFKALRLAGELTSFGSKVSSRIRLKIRQLQQPCALDPMKRINVMLPIYFIAYNSKQNTTKHFYNSFRRSN
jgi:hypothetical protein